ncbi:hypothetical protein PoB_000494400 [Plakobranchus ocellatus]|uniref:Uncharacterized protein n=1 Tax=Plakobranchus ocellatus TaxID=259542 RepID=A0AAV3Y860_9GAST|nr:hypothetical protein PoB_000494400 [Plakobranchus ocellatus]
MEDQQKILPKCERMEYAQKGCRPISPDDTSFQNGAHEDNGSHSLQKGKASSKFLHSRGESNHRTISEDSESSNNDSSDNVNSHPPTHAEFKSSVSSWHPTRSKSAILPWLFACFAISVLSLLAVSLVWTVVSYRGTLYSLEDRLQRLELAHLDYSNRIDELVAKKVDARVKQILAQQYHEFRSINKRQAECQCVPGK